MATTRLQASGHRIDLTKLTAPTERLKTTFFSTVHPQPWAPTKGTFNRIMLEGLTQQHDVRAIVPVPWVERARSRRRAPTASYPVVTRTFWYLPVLDRLSLANRMQRAVAGLLAEEIAPDLILSYWTDPDGTAALDWGRRIGRPVVQIVGGSDVLVLAGDPARRARIAATLSGATQVLAIGEGVRRAVLSLGIPEERVHVISRGVDRSRFQPQAQATARTALGLPHDIPLLVWVGRMVPVKGLDVLLRALATPMLRHSDVKLILVGDGPLRGQLERLARDLDIVDRIRFAGVVEHDKLPDWYAAADRVVLPSRSEGVPNVLLEGLACGTPFFASDVGGVAELTPNRDWLLPVGDAEAWTTRLQTWLDSPDNNEPLPAIADQSEAAVQLAGLLESAANRTP